VSREQYGDWFADLDDRFQEQVREEWGDPPERPFAIPGVEFGNVLVTVQPPRGFGMDPSKVYHDSDLQPPHDYVAFYAWLRNAFEADAVVHLGTHGSLEWLPGKTVGLNAESAPDQLVDDLPNVYPYIVNNPGEGTQAKRRSYAAIVDYLTPVMRNAGAYEELGELEELASRYREAGMEDARSDDGEALAERLRELVDELDLAVELGIEGEISEKADVRGPDAAGSTLAEGEVAGDSVDVEELVERVHEYVTDVKTTQIRMGLHTLSEPPAGERLVEYLVALTRLENPGAPSLRQSVAGVLGVDHQRMLDEPGTYVDDLGMTYAEAADEVYDTCLELVEHLAEHDFDADAINWNLLVVDVDPVGDGRARSGAHDDLREVLRFICEEAQPRVDGASDEVPGLQTRSTASTSRRAGAARQRAAASTSCRRRGTSTRSTRGRSRRARRGTSARKSPTASLSVTGRSTRREAPRNGRAGRGTTRETKASTPEEVGVVAWGRRRCGRAGRPSRKCSR